MGRIDGVVLDQLNAAESSAVIEAVVAPILLISLHAHVSPFDTSQSSVLIQVSLGVKVFRINLDSSLQRRA